MWLNNFLSNRLSHVKFSQLGQDILALSMFGKNGYFVEFGAADGFHLSNTFLLENKYEWKGIICEPNRNFHSSVIKRKCNVDLRCVYTSTGDQVMFSSVNESNELSTISLYEESDSWAETRSSNSERYLVETVSLDDLLISHNAPRRINYISIDTEGSEFDILNSFSFDYEIGLFTIEHNFNSRQHDIDVLMSSKGYTRILHEYSMWDGWYVLNG